MSQAPSRVDSLSRVSSLDHGWTDFTFKRRDKSCKSKFIRVDASDGFGTMREMANRINHLLKESSDGRPSLLFSVTGTAAKELVFRDNLFNRFSNELMRAATSCDAWIFTGGTEAGIMQTIGKMQSAWGYPIKCCLAIAPWGCIKNRETLMSDEPLAAEPGLEYDNKTVSEGVQGTFLDPNHSHYVLFDNGMTIEKDGLKAYGGEHLFSNALEASVTEDGSQVPGIQIVYGGGKCTINTMLGAATKHMPILVVANSGRVADIVHARYHHHEKQFERLLLSELKGCSKNEVEEWKVKIDSVLEQGQLSFYDILGEEENLSQIIIDALVQGPLTKAVKLTTLANWTTLNSSGAKKDVFTEKAHDTLHRLLTVGIYEQLRMTREVSEGEGGVYSMSDQQLRMTHEVSEGEELDEELLVHAAYHNKGDLFRDLLDCGYRPALLDELIKLELGSPKTQRETIDWTALYKNVDPDKIPSFRISNLLLKNYNNGSEQNDIEFYSKSPEEAALMKGFLLKDALHSGEGFPGCIVLAKEEDAIYYDADAFDWATLERSSSSSGSSSTRGNSSSLQRTTTYPCELQREKTCDFDDELKTEWEEAKIEKVVKGGYSLRFADSENGQQRRATLPFDKVNPRELSWFDRLYWALVTDRSDLVFPLCDKSEHSMSAALAALKISNRLKKFLLTQAQPTPIKIQRFENLADKLDEYATNVLDGILDCKDAEIVITDEIDVSSQITFNFLIPNLKLGIENQCCIFDSSASTRLDFAIHADSRSFLSHPHVRSHMEKLELKYQFWGISGFTWETAIYFCFLCVYFVWRCDSTTPSNDYASFKHDTDVLSADYGMADNLHTVNTLMCGFLYGYCFWLAYDEYDKCMHTHVLTQKSLTVWDFEAYDVLGFFCAGELIRIMQYASYGNVANLNEAVVRKVLEFCMTENEFSRIKSQHTPSLDTLVQSSSLDVQTISMAFCLFFGVLRLMDQLSTEWPNKKSGFSIVYMTAKQILKNDLVGIASLLGLIMFSFIPMMCFVSERLRNKSFTSISEDLVELMVYPALGEQPSREAKEEDGVRYKTGVIEAFLLSFYFFLTGKKQK
jgi:hypothetical protein